MSLNCYSSVLVPGAADTKVTDLWSFIPSYNHCGHVSLMLSSTLVAQGAKISYPANGMVRPPSLSECSVEIRLRLTESFLAG